MPQWYYTKPVSKSKVALEKNKNHFKVRAEIGETPTAGFLNTLLVRPHPITKYFFIYNTFLISTVSSVA